MENFREMQSYIGFCDEDQTLLRAFWPLVAPHVGEITDHFYARILAHPQAAAILQDEDQVERLKCTLQEWLAGLLQGPWDEPYYRHRQRIGHAHVRVGLPARYMFTAMSVVRDDLCHLASEARHGDELEALCTAIRRVTEIDLATITSTYMEAREARQLADINELIVSFMPVTVLLVDEHGRVVMGTRSAEHLLEQRELEGQNYAELLPVGLVEAADLTAQVNRALETQREITLVRVDAILEGKARNFRINLVPLEHPAARLLLHVEELTDTVETETRMQRSEALAHLGAMSASVAHELRNPLAGISAAIQILRRSLPEADRRRAVLERIEDQIQRLNLLVSDLLDFARPGTARMADIALDDVVRGVLTLVIDDHPGVDVRLVGEGRAHADPNLVHQIVLNLVQNALQAVGEKGSVRIAVERGRVVVADSGPGVPVEAREKVFTPFFTTRTRGTGLGLAVCRRAARTMNAEVELLEDGPLAGAAFALLLPMGPEDPRWSGPGAAVG